MFCVFEAETPPKKQLVEMKKQMGFPSFWEKKLSSLVIQFLLTLDSAACSAEKHPSTLNI